MEKLNVQHIYLVPKWLNCYKAILVISGRAHCFQWFHMLCPSCFCEIWAFCVSWTIICAICIISKWSSSIGQTLIKIKHKVKWIVKFAKTWNLHHPLPPTCPSSHVHSFLGTTKHLEKIRLHMVYTTFVNSLKRFFE